MAPRGALPGSRRGRGRGGFGLQCGASLPHQRRGDGDETGGAAMTPATSTTSFLALLGSAGVLALLVIAISFLRRRSLLVRQLTFPLVLAALAATLLVFGRLRPGYAWLPAALSWTLLFLGLATILRLLAMFLFDVHLMGQRGVRQPPLLPAVAMTLVFLVTPPATPKLSFPGFA